MLRLTHFSALLVAIWLAGLTTAASASPKAAGTYRDWNVFTLDQDDGDRICFAVTEPSSKSPRNVRHGDIFILVSSWKSGAASEQPSFMAGYNLKNGSKPIVRIGARRFEMFASEKEAFVESNGEEQSLVEAMRRGSAMTVQATSERGTAVTYDFSLLGISAALERVESACS